VAQALNKADIRNDEIDDLKAKVRETARSFIAGAARRSPMIIPVVLEV